MRWLCWLTRNVYPSLPKSRASCVWCDTEDSGVSPYLCDDGRVPAVGVLDLFDGDIVPEQVAVDLGGVGVKHL